MFPSFVGRVFFFVVVHLFVFLFGFGCLVGVFCFALGLFENQCLVFCS